MLFVQQPVFDLINEKYNILETIDLFLYESVSDQLYQLLYRYKNYTFLPQDRILIFHHDTDYYVSGSSHGFTIHNLVIMLNNLNIPNEFIIMLTNHYGIKKEIQEQFNNISSTNSFKVIYTSLWYDFPKDITLENPKTGKIKKLYCCLNGRQRAHRVALLCHLAEKKLVDQGIISYHFSKNND